MRCYATLTGVGENAYRREGIFFKLKKFLLFYKRHHVELIGVLHYLCCELRDIRKDTAALIPGPVPLGAGFRVFGGTRMTIQFVYLDEFGHLGPFMARTASKYNESPVFGLAGIILPDQAVRPFATQVLKLKEFIFKDEIQRSGQPSSHWEKKGTEIFTAKQIAKYSHFRSTGFRLINYVRDMGSPFATD